MTATGETSLTDRADRFLADPAARADPYAFYRELRETTPVLRTAGDVWMVASYAGVQEVLHSDQFSRAEAARTSMAVDVPEAVQIFASRMINIDRPELTRLRGVVKSEFTPGKIKLLEEHISELVDETLDPIREKGQMDLLSEYSFPAAERVITSLLGVPSGDLDLFRRWSEMVGAAPANAGERERRDAANQAITEFAAYVRKRVAERTASPAKDLLTRLILAEDDEGVRLQEHELLGLCYEIVTAGHETVSVLTANGMLLLLNHPDQLAALREDRALLPTAIEEMLRFESPVGMSNTRIAVDDVDVDGVTIPKGHAALPLLASANRDEAVFESADSFDIRRSPNPHIGLGMGGHFCLGASLARLTAGILFERLLDLPDVRLERPARWAHHPFFRTLEELRIAWN